MTGAAAVTATADLSELLAATAGFLILRITDKGKGFDLASVEPGLGLSSLRSRAEKAGGDTTLHSRLGRGTTAVRVLLPI